MAGNDAAARHLLADARAAVIGVDYPPGAISVLQAETLNGFFTGDFRSAKSAASQGVRLALEAKDRYTPEMMQLNLGSAALLTGDLSEARPLLEQALMLARQIDDRVGQFYLLDALGCHAALTGNARRAAQLFGAADTARTEAGANVMRFFAPLCAKARESAVSALGASRFAAAFDTGRRLGRDTAIQLARGQPAPSAAGTSPGSSPSAP